ncbi:MAG: hypothetical protein ACYDAE_24640 [Steroidobacteraceae bacterium]
MGYGRLKLSSSGCVHFMHADFFSGETQAAVGDLRSAGIRCVYADYRNLDNGDLHIANAIARALNLQHAPYPPPTSPFQPQVWVPFLDDLIALSEQEKGGIVIFVDSADVFLAQNRREMFRLIEAFLIQVDEWMEKRKPCHLCFQMEPNDSLGSQFVTS